LHDSNFQLWPQHATNQQHKPAFLPLAPDLHLTAADIYTKELAMRKPQFVLPELLPIFAPLIVWCLMIRPSFGRNVDDASRIASSGAPAHSQPMQTANVDNSSSHNGDRDTGQSSVTTFQGRIVRSGNRLVLTSIDNTTYQLDNQQKAHNFLNQNVKVTGDLDATTGTIRIHAIDLV
jgi:hypothetical protein